MKKWKYQKRSKPCTHCTLWGENGPLAFEVRKIILEPEIIIILNNIIRLLNESVHFFISMKFLVARVLREKFSWLPPSGVPKSVIRLMWCNVMWLEKWSHVISLYHWMWWIRWILAENRKVRKKVEIGVKIAGKTLELRKLAVMYYLLKFSSRISSQWMDNTLEQYSYFQGTVCNFVEF